MKKFARVQENVVVEIIESDNIENQFHPDLIKTFVECDDNVCVGMFCNGKKFEKPKSLIDDFNLPAEQYSAIDAHIASCIKSNGWDYDSLGEIAAYALLSDTYKVEARAIWDWVESCHAIQTDIKNGVKKYDSVEMALKALPPFDME